MLMFVAASGHRVTDAMPSCLGSQSVTDAKHDELCSSVDTSCGGEILAMFPHKNLAALQVCPLEGCGIQLRVQGFSHKLPLLTRYITHQLATLTAQVGATAQQPCLAS